jgi:uncharacterized protein with FMN-binding domain
MKKQKRANLFETSGEAAKKVFVSALIIGVFIVYSMLHNRSAANTPLPGIATGSSTPTSAATTPGSTDPTATAVGDTSGNSTGLYKDGSYTGGIADAQWGYVQIKVDIQNGKMTNVQFLQYPNDRQRSIEINSYADPQLVQEAIQAQSAQVDIITGATDSSEAFMQSLSDALTQAQG